MKRKKLDRDNRMQKKKKVEGNLTNIAKIFSKEQFTAFEQYMEENRVRMNSLFASRL